MIRIHSRLMRIHYREEPLPRVFPQVISAQYTKDDKLIAVYSNMSLAVFNAQDFKKVEIQRLIKHHADCIWGVLVTIAFGHGFIDVL